MIDFRYHLVSLISVFLALAVGIALGAGPLKESIGDTLTGQVDQLRTDRDQLSAELDEARADLARSQEAMGAVAPALLSGVLNERRVAVIELGEVDGDVREQVVERLGQAGAQVTATVEVTEEWLDPERASFRQQLAGTLVDYLDPVPPESAGAGTELAESLTQALTAAMAGEPDRRSADAEVVLDLLVDGGLVAVEGDVTLPADAVVILAGPTVSVQEAEDATAQQESQAPEDVAVDTELDQARLEAAAQLATAAQLRSSGAVVAGGDYTETGVLQRVRQDQPEGARVSTVEAVHTPSGQVAVPLALSARIGGTVGHYGTSPEATAVMPPYVVLPTVERVAPEPEQAPDGTGGSEETAAEETGAETTGAGEDESGPADGTGEDGDTVSQGAVGQDAVAQG